MKRADGIYLLDTAVLKNSGLFDRYYRQMPGDRKDKTDAKKTDSGKRLCLGAGIVLSKALDDAGITVTVGNNEGIKDKDESLSGKYLMETGPQGKPYLSGCEDFFFNISHSGTMAMVAVSSREVGADIQELNHFDDRLINYVFNESDLELAKELMPLPVPALCPMTADSRTEVSTNTPDLVYTRMWAMKESVMKHNGKGIGLDPRKITLSLEGGNLKASHPAFDFSGLYITEYLFSSYAIAICSEHALFPCSPGLIELR